MEYVVQAFKVLKNLVYAEANTRAQRTGVFFHFPNPNTISLRDYQFFYACLEANAQRLFCNNKCTFGN